MNSEVLVKAAQVWVDVFDFEGVGQRPRTLPVKPTLHQAGASAFYSDKHDVLSKGFSTFGEPKLNNTYVCMVLYLISIKVSQS